MQIIYNNDVINSDVTTNSENLNYPVTNIQDTRLSRFYRSEVNENVLIDLYKENMTQVYKSCILVNTNLSVRAAITIRANVENSFINAPFEATFIQSGDTWISQFEEPESPDYKESIMFGDLMFDDFMFGEETLSTYNYWQIEIDDPANKSDYVQMGAIILGGVLQLPAMEQNQTISNVTTSLKSFGNSGQLYGSSRYNYKEAKANFPFITKDKKLEIETMFEFTDNYKPVLMLMYEDDLTILKPLYCNLNFETLVFERNKNISSPFKCSFNFREVF